MRQDTNVSKNPAASTEDGGSMVLRNVGILPQYYTASRARPRFESSPPLKSQISQALLFLGSFSDTF
jgi:hypothetical protein